MEAGSNPVNDFSGLGLLLVYTTDILFVTIAPRENDIFKPDTFLLYIKYISSYANDAVTRILVEIMLSFLGLCYNTFRLSVIPASSLWSN
jgi:hypothetical protein